MILRPLAPLFVLVFLITAALPLRAQTPATQPDAPEAAAATQPATAPAARRTLVMPPGFIRVEGAGGVGGAGSAGVVVLCQEADAAWVRDSLSSYTPATRPSTMPADLLQRVAAERKGVIDAMMKDLALTDRAPLERFFDQTMIPELQRLEAFQPPVFFLVTTTPALRQLIKDQAWSDPRFYYNRVADEVMFTEAIPLSLDKPMDDTVIPVLHEQDWDALRRREHLVKTIRTANRELQQAVSGRAQFHCHMSLIDFMMGDVFNSINFKPGQQWLALGAAGVLSCDYTHQLTGAERRELLAMLLVEIRRRPVPTAAVDLLHPVDVSVLRKEAVNAYSDAVRRKSVFVVRKWIDKSGRESFTRVLELMRKSPPADGEGLIAVIKADSGVDLAADVGRK